MTSTVARSERLVLRGWDDADVGDLAAIGTPEVVRYLGGKPWTEATGRESINLFRSIGETLVVTTWAVELRSTGELIGTCGYARTNVDWLRRDYVVEIGWTLGRPWWGRGLASEAARAALGLAMPEYVNRWVCSILRHGGPEQLSSAPAEGSGRRDSPNPAIGGRVSYTTAPSVRPST